MITLKIQNITYKYSIKIQCVFEKGLIEFKIEAIYLIDTFCNVQAIKKWQAEKVPDEGKNPTQKSEPEEMPLKDTP